MRPLGPPPTTTTSDSAYRSRSLVNPLRIARVTSASLAGWKRGMVPPWDSLQPKMGILQFLVRRRDKRYILGYGKRYQESGECEHPAVSIESLRGEKAPPASRNLDRDLPDGVRGDEDPEPIPRREELHVRHHAQPVLDVARIESLHARRARVRLEVPDRVVRVVGWKADEVPARAQGHRLSARWPRALEVQRAGRSDLNPERHGVVDDSQVVPRPRRVVSPPRVGARSVVRADNTVATRHRGQDCRTRCVRQDERKTHEPPAEVRGRERNPEARVAAYGHARNPGRVSRRVEGLGFNRVHAEDQQDGLVPSRRAVRREP